MEQPEFMKEYLGAQRGIYAYIRASGFDISDADDLAQEVAMALWEGHAEYVPSKPFVAWAIGVAKNVIRNKRRHDGVRSGTVVDTDLCEQIGDCVGEALETLGAALDEEKEKLEGCVERLPDRSKDLLRLRYVDGLSLGRMAKHLGRSYGAVNVALSRIRDLLMECVRREATATRQ